MPRDPRNLIEFFNKPDPKTRDTDVRYTSFLGEGAEKIDVGLREELQKDIGQRMSHMTTHRTPPNLEGEIRRAIADAVREFLDRLDPEWFAGAVTRARFEELLSTAPAVRWGTVLVNSTSSTLG
jgi:hypothetical protein